MRETVIEPLTQNLLEDSPEEEQANLYIVDNDDVDSADSYHSNRSLHFIARFCAV